MFTKFFTVLSVLIFMSSCGDSGSGKKSVDLNFPVGNYATDCVNLAPNSASATLTISEGYTTRQNTTSNFSGVTNCSGSPTVSTVTETGPFSFSNVDLGKGVSYYSSQVTANDPVQYVPFVYAEGKIYFGAESSDISSGAATVFANFIQNYQTDPAVITVIFNKL